MSKRGLITLVTIVGARPQFVKAAVFSREWRRRQKEILIHTGQHYDPMMSAVFFRELGLPRPDYQLRVSGNSHGVQTGRMMAALEPILSRINPDGVLLYGDTNSALAGALTASKLRLPIFHIEAGLRSYRKTMPEEINRLVVDHLSDLLFAPTDTAVKNLKREGITKGVSCVGDIMWDAFKCYRPKQTSLTVTLPIRQPYALVTIHRAHSTDNPRILSSLCQALSHLPVAVLWPIHPRTRQALRHAKIKLGSNITIIEPVGYIESLEIQSQAECILTDSGGVQREAYFLRKPCVTLRHETEWIETLQSGHNVLGGYTTHTVLSAYQRAQAGQRKAWPSLFGTGDAGKRASAIILKHLSEHSGKGHWYG